MAELEWRSYCICAEEGSHPEIAVDNKVKAVFIRDCKKPDNILTFTFEEWEAFKKGLLNGEFSGLG